MEAWDYAPDEYAKLQTASALAPLGEGLPDLSDLDSTQAEAVKALRQIHDVMASGDDKLALLRARAPESIQLTVLLADELRTSDNPLEAAVVLQDGANRWNHPLLMRMAADSYRRSGQNELAGETATAALAMGGKDWPGNLDALGIRFDALESQGLLMESLQVARQMVALEPSNLNVRWNLVHCLVRRGDLDAAWASLTPTGDPVSPRGVEDAPTWIALTSTYDKSQKFISRSLVEMHRWTAFPDIIGLYLARIYTALLDNEHEILETDLASLHAATEEYTHSHPDSPTFQMLPVGPDDNPLEAAEPELRRQAENEPLSELRLKVARGHLPLAFLAEASGRSYTEAAIRRAAGVTLSHDISAVSAAPDESVAVLDITAAVALALLDPAIVDLLVGRFQSLQTTDRAFRDSLNAQQSLQLRSTLSVVWDPERQRAVPVEISELTANSLADHADATVRILTRANRQAWPALKSFEASAGKFQSLSALDLAITTSTPFWCDDRVMRRLTRQMGAESFGTIDLIRTMVDQRKLQKPLAEIAQSVLLQNYHADIEFSPRIWRLAGQLAGWMPEGAAGALKRPASWMDAEETFAFLLTALEHAVATCPDGVSGWVFCAATGLLKIQSEDDDGASENLAILFSRILGQRWMRPDVLPLVLAGIRDATQERGEVIDPLAPCLHAVYRTLKERHTTASAAELLLRLTSNLSPSDKDAAARIILLDRS